MMYSICFFGTKGVIAICDNLTQIALYGRIVFILIPYALLYKQRIKFRELLGIAVSMTGVALFFLL